MNFKKEKNKESYHTRRKRAYDTLREFGISMGLARRTVYRYPLNLLEKLIKETEKRQPNDPADYFFNGLKRSRIKYGDNRKRDRKRKFWSIEE
ncbi:MAG: hypothetical protein U9R21_09480 [Candidatus Thermoplasmatota archaeon]|nr:hypothetical protein [Candidatus Thermoplasmatota archaeon]